MVPPNTSGSRVPTASRTWGGTEPEVAIWLTIIISIIIIIIFITTTVVIIVIMMLVHCRPIPSAVRNRPYQADSTTSRPICEVKLPRARVVLRWGTTWEVRVLILLRVLYVRTHVLYVILLIFLFF